MRRIEIVTPEGGPPFSLQEIDAIELDA